MLLLKIITLLDHYKVAFHDVVKIVYTSKSEQDFYNQIEQYIQNDRAKFDKVWMLEGVNKDKVTIWKRLLLTYFFGNIASKIATVLSYSQTDVENNVEGCATVINLVARELSIADFRLGQNLGANIAKSTETIILNSKSEYAKKFRVSLTDPNIQAALIGDEENHLAIFDNQIEALTNVQPEKVRCILSDIYDTKPMYHINTVKHSRRQYSMYESFVKAYFRRDMEKLNKELDGYITVTMESVSEVKFKKLDDLMKLILEDFILPGITVDNLGELMKVVAVSVEEGSVTNAAPPFNQQKISLQRFPTALGNFHNWFTFNNENSSEKFDKMIRGFIALSDLYRYITLAGKTPYDISIDTFMYDDPSLKFTSLKDLVFHSDTYSEVRAKYGISEDFSSLTAVGNIRNQSAEILANRRQINFNALTNTVSAVRDGNACSVYLSDSGKQMNIFDAVRLFSEQKNPLYSLLGEEIFDEDVIIDDMSEYFTEIFGGRVGEYSEFRLKPDTMQNLLAVSGGDLHTFLCDLTHLDPSHQLKMFKALELFLEDFAEMLTRHEKRYIGCHVSQVELSTIVLKSENFKSLRDKCSDYNNVDEVTKTLLNKYDSTITLEEVKNFFERDIENDSYSRFLEVVRQNVFKAVGSIYKNADLYLYNLQEVGKQLRLSSAAIQLAAESVTYNPNMDRFRIRFADEQKDTDGYFIDDQKNLKYPKTKNNKTGYLHSSGVYIFPDGTFEIWS